MFQHIKRRRWSPWRMPGQIYGGSRRILSSKLSRPWKPQIANFCDLNSHVQIYVLSESKRTQTRKRHLCGGAVYPAPSRREPSIPSKHKPTFHKIVCPAINQSISGHRVFCERDNATTIRICCCGSCVLLWQLCAAEEKI